MNGRTVEWMRVLGRGALLALPAIFLIRQESWSLHCSHHDVGWPLAWADLQIQGDEYGSIAFYPHWFYAVPLMILLTMVGGVLRWLRKWVIGQADWWAAIVQCALTCIYAILLLCFFCGFISFLWEAKLEALNLLTYRHTLRFGAHWLLPLYCFGAVGMMLILYFDSRRRTGAQRAVYLLPVCVMLYFTPLITSYCSWQMVQLQQLADSPPPQFGPQGSKLRLTR